MQEQEQEQVQEQEQEHPASSPQPSQPSPSQEREPPQPSPAATPAATEGPRPLAANQPPMLSSTPPSVPRLSSPAAPLDAPSPRRLAPSSGPCSPPEWTVCGLKAPPARTPAPASDLDDESRVVAESQQAAIDELRIIAPTTPRERCQQVLESCEYDLTAAACELLVAEAGLGCSSTRAAAEPPIPPP